MQSTSITSTGMGEERAREQGVAGIVSKFRCVRKVMRWMNVVREATTSMKGVNLRKKDDDGRVMEDAMPRCGARS